MGSALGQDLLISEFSCILPLEHVWIYRVISVYRITELRESPAEENACWLSLPWGGLNDGESGN